MVIKLRKNDYITSNRLDVNSVSFSFKMSLEYILPSTNSNYNCNFTNCFNIY